MTEERQQQQQQRPWGGFEVLLSEPHCKVKRLLVAPGHQLSLQSHRHRDETWVVVRGAGFAVVGEAQRSLAYGDVVEVPRGTAHRLGASPAAALEVLEVQTGTSFEEDDIVRLADDYGRVVAEMT
jgi:mannose-6-phosphate isomerase-like protein (cupin superfamily)